MTTYTDDPDGFTLVESRAFEPGAGLAFTSTGVLSGHPIDVYRRRHAEQTAGLGDLAVLEFWYADELDRRLTAACLPREYVSPTITRLDAGKITAGRLITTERAGRSPRGER